MIGQLPYYHIHVADENKDLGGLKPELHSQKDMADIHVHYVVVELVGNIHAYCVL